MARPRPLTSPRTPARHSDLFGPPPLIDGEDPGLCRALSDRFLSDQKPSDIIEECFVNDLMHSRWDILRYRRLKCELMCTKKFDAFEDMPGLLGKVRRHLPDYDEEKLRALIDNWIDCAAKRSVECNQSLAQAGLTWDALMAATLSENINVIGRIEELIAMAEARFSNALRELYRHRASADLARHLPIQQIEDNRARKRAA